MTIGLSSRAAVRPLHLSSRARWAVRPLHLSSRARAAARRRVGIYSNVIVAAHIADIMAPDMPPSAMMWDDIVFAC